ncbi:MAG: hypothetical protein LBD91_03165 [Prevotellaceae bacterium]|jgi:hypothetical protein|nr:hypothetical protein [Prevotellaceae bacterium]
MMNFDIYRLIRMLLPSFLWQPIRLARLEAWLTPFIDAWMQYLLWREDVMYEAHVTAQVISIEAYLNRRFDREQKRIEVMDANFDNRVFVALRTEPYEDCIYGDGTFVPLEAEMQAQGFAVIIPADLEPVAQQVSGTVDKVKAVGTVYTIVIRQ